MSQVKSKVEPSPSRRLWSVRETANVLGVSTRTVWRMIAAGEIKSTRLGRCVRVVAKSVEEFIERGGAR